MQELSAQQCDALEVSPESPARFAVRLQDETLPLLDLTPLEPGALIQPISPPVALPATSPSDADLATS
jgi:hypothetical protein